MTWSIHTSLSISRLCSDNVANDPNQLGNADVGTIHTFLFWYQFVKLQFGIWLQFAANLYKLLTARRAVSTNLLQISSTPNRRAFDRQTQLGRSGDVLTYVPKRRRSVEAPRKGTVPGHLPERSGDDASRTVSRRSPEDPFQ